MTESSWAGQEEELEKLGDQLQNDKLDAILCVAGGWAGGNASSKGIKICVGQNEHFSIKKYISPNSTYCYQSNTWSNLKVFGGQVMNFAE